MSFVLRLLRLLAALFALGMAALAAMAYFGFAVPAFDLLNHGQPFLFAGTLVGLVAVLLLLRGGRGKRAAAGLAIVGLIASSATYLPEALSGLAPAAVPPDVGRTVVRIMTHNVFGKNYDAARVVSVIRQEDPDIIAFQEFFPEQRGALTPLLKKAYPYSVHCRGGKRANLALFSRIPFTQGDKFACPDDAYGGQRTAHILAEFALRDGGHFSVITTHLDWPYPIERQAGQMAELAQVAAAVQGPLVVMGDFNSTPWSYALRGFGDKTGLTRWTRDLWTYPMRFSIKGWRDTLPFLPLDQVFTRGMDVYALHAAAPTGSDHLPVVFEVSVGR